MGPEHYAEALAAHRGVVREARLPATAGIEVDTQGGAFVEAWEEGLTLSLDEAVALALGEDRPRV